MKPLSTISHKLCTLNLLFYLPTTSSFTYLHLQQMLCSQKDPLRPEPPSHLVYIHLTSSFITPSFIYPQPPHFLHSQQMPCPQKDPLRPQPPSHLVYILLIHLTLTSSFVSFILHSKCHALKKTPYDPNLPHIFDSYQ